MSTSNWCDRNTVDLLILSMWKWCFHAWIHTHDKSAQRKHLFRIWALFTNQQWLMGSEEPLHPAPLSLRLLTGIFTCAGCFWICQNDLVNVIVSYWSLWTSLQKQQLTSAAPRFTQWCHDAETKGSSAVSLQPSAFMVELRHRGNMCLFTARDGD